MQDYSAHQINTHKRLKQVHLLLLKNKFEESTNEIDEAIVELRMMKASINNLKEKHEARN